MIEYFETLELIADFNNQLHGFPRGGMGILDADIMARATEIICKWILF